MLDRTDGDAAGVPAPPADDGCTRRDFFVNGSFQAGRLAVPPATPAK